MFVAIFKTRRQFLELLANAWKERPTQIPGGFVVPIDKTQSRGSIPAVDELPPEAIAPNLRRQVRSAGFGSNSSEKDRDTQLHERDQGQTGSEGSNKPSYPTTTNPTKTKICKPTKGG
jgi:hypothetical protein